MLSLIFSKEENVVNETQNTYEQLYFDKNLSPKKKTENLLNLMKGATLTDLTCLEELVKKFMTKGILDKEIIKILMKIYTKKNFESLQSLPTE